MAKIRMQKPTNRAQLLSERVKQEREYRLHVERKLQRELNKGSWRFRAKRVHHGQIIDLWCSVLILGVQVHLREPRTEPEFLEDGSILMHFTCEDVLEGMSDVVQIIEAAAASQDAVLKVVRRA